MCMCLSPLDTMCFLRLVVCGTASNNAFIRAYLRYTFKAKNVLYIERAFCVRAVSIVAFVCTACDVACVYLWLNKLKRSYTQMFWFSCVNTLTNTCKWNSWFQPLWCDCMRLRLWKTQNNVQTWKIERESDYILLCTAYTYCVYFLKYNVHFHDHHPAKLNVALLVYYTIFIEYMYAVMHQAWNVHRNRMRSL